MSQRENLSRKGNKLSRGGRKIAERTVEYKSSDVERNKMKRTKGLREEEKKV